MVPVALIITGVTFVFTFHMRCISIIRSLYFLLLLLLLLLLLWVYDFEQQKWLRTFSSHFLHNILLCFTIISYLFFREIKQF
jgi:hypothetical protein